MYSHIFLNIQSVHIILLVWVFSELLFGAGQPAGVLFPASSFLPLPLVLLVGLKPPELVPVQADKSVGVFLVQFMLGQSCWWDVTGGASDVTRRHTLTVGGRWIPLSLLRTCIWRALILFYFLSILGPFMWAADFYCSAKWPCLVTEKLWSVLANMKDDVIRLD